MKQEAAQVLGIGPSFVWHQDCVCVWNCTSVVASLAAHLAYCSLARQKLISQQHFWSAMWNYCCSVSWRNNSNKPPNIIVLGSTRRVSGPEVKGTAGTAHPDPRHGTPPIREPKVKSRDSALNADEGSRVIESQLKRHTPNTFWHLCKSTHTGIPTCACP